MRISLPVEPSDRSLLLVVERLGTPGALHIGATDLIVGEALDSAALPSMDETESEGLRFTALRYGEPLASLGLTAGVVEPLAPERGGVPLPPTSAISVVDLARGQAAATWEERDAMPEALVRVAIRDEPTLKCQALVATVFDLSTDQDLAFITSLTEETALIGDEAGALFYFGPDEIPAATGSVEPGREILAVQVVYEGPERVYWLGGPDGLVRRTSSLGPLGLFGVTVRDRAPSRGHLFSLDGAYTGEIIDELFTLSTEGLFERQFGGVWTELHRGAPSAIGGVVRVGPGEAYAAHERSGVLHFRDGALLVDEIDESRPIVTAIARVPKVGLVIATADGIVLRRGEDGWQVLTDVGPDLRPELILPYREGFLVGGVGGRLVQFVPNAQKIACPLLNAGAATLGFGAVLGDAVIVGGTRYEGSSFTTLAVLRPRR
ncbi:MAG: hypothetical protein IT384_32065 [Deltaproteobacteria bacterium]|nr:hypothetical protein [Deltaproteobacteria bacterium]